MDHHVAQEQLCYIPCNFCSIVLAVSVPYSSLFETVTVRCGHCTNLWSVNMGAAFQSLQHQQQQQQSSVTQTSPPAALNKSSSSSVHHHVQAASNSVRQYKPDSGSSSKWNKAAQHYSTANKPDQRTVNRPPEKRQRVPSAYNQFIKEEIQRIKANNPDISHREAFSTAAKNWAHFPHIHFGLMLETNNRA